MTPTQRSLALLKREGYTCGDVQRWNHHAGIRQDLWGFDLLAIKPGARPMLVQIGVQGDIGKHFKKIAALPTTEILWESFALEIHGWRVLKLPRIHAECDRRRVVAAFGKCELVQMPGATTSRARKFTVAESLKGESLPDALPL